MEIKFREVGYIKPWLETTFTSDNCTVKEDFNLESLTELACKLLSDIDCSGDNEELILSKLREHIPDIIDKAKGE